MFIEEAIWIRDILGKLHLKKDQVVLDLGSNNKEYRCLLYPFIDYYVFRPLREIGLKVIHTDRTKDEGVDIVCDLASVDFNKAQKHIENGDIILCTSLLEHIEDHELIIERIGELANPGAVIIVTVPYIYPSHIDPIDTMYRPTDAELVNEFSSKYYEKIASDILSVKGRPDSPGMAGKENLLIRTLNRLVKKMDFELKPVLPEFKVSVIALKYRGREENNRKSNFSTLLSLPFESGR